MTPWARWYGRDAFAMVLGIAALGAAARRPAPLGGLQISIILLGALVAALGAHREATRHHLREWSIPLLEIGLVSLVMSILLGGRYPAMTVGSALTVLAVTSRIHSRAVRAVLATVVGIGGFVAGLLVRHLARAKSLATEDLLALFQTNLREAVGFAEALMTMSQGVALLLLGVWIVARPRALGSLPPALAPRKARTGAVLLATGLFLTTMAPSAEGSARNLHRWADAAQNLRRAIETQEALVERLGRRGLPPPHSDLRPARFSGTVIVIVGESLNRHHFGIYGYHRPTTPALRRRLAEGSLVVHQDTVAPHSHTVPALGEVLTSFDFDRGDRLVAPRLDEDLQLNEDGSWFSIFEALEWSDVRTSWLSVQDEFGVYENPISVLARRADAVTFRNSADGFGLRRIFDEALVEDLENELDRSARSRVVFLHLLAGHVSYCRNIPPNWRGATGRRGLGAAFFGNATDRSSSVACYDDAIRYVDHVTDRVIEIVASRDKPAVVVFLADHGEDPRGGTGHQNTLHRGEHVEIPFFWYFNPSASTLLAEKRSRLIGRINAPFKSSALYETLLDLVDADPRLWESSRSILAPQWTPSRRRTVPRPSGSFVAYDEPIRDNKDGSQWGRISLRDLASSQPEVYARIWAHRVNSLGKLLETKRSFAGLETDLVFERSTERFFVTHPPASPTGLTLESWLAATRDVPELRLWLDWKNPTPEDLPQALRRLEHLDRTANLKARVVVETPSDALFPALQALSASGFEHSYYLPTGEILACSGSSGGCGNLAVDLARRAREIGAGAVSFDIRLATWVEKNRDAFSGLRRRAWDLSLDATRPGLAESLPNLDQLKLDALLVSFPSRFDR